MNNMSQGLAMFDAEHGSSYATSDYAEMYGLTPEQVKPGTTVREILDARVANGCYAMSEPRQYVEKLVAQFEKIESEVQELADGRIITVGCRRTANGGHVITHRGHHRAPEAQLAHELEQQEEKLRLQNMQLDAALNNMVQGLAMFDAEQRSCSANKRYAEIYGLTPSR